MFQRHHRIHLGCAPGGNQTGEKGDYSKQQCNGGKCAWISRHSQPKIAFDVQLKMALDLFIDFPIRALLVEQPTKPHNQFTKSAHERYSARRAIIGSTLAARRAGSQLASAAAAISTVVTAMKVIGSWGVMP